MMVNGAEQRPLTRDAVDQRSSMGLRWPQETHCFVPKLLHDEPRTFINFPAVLILGLL